MILPGSSYDVGKMYIREAISLIVPYARKRLLDQVKAVMFIVTYMIGFQTLILGSPIQDTLTITAGLALVVIGLAFFMEGLVLGLMPLGESIGLRLPRRAHISVLILFAFVLGIGATFAEPAIGVLKAAGLEVKAWEAPLLFRLLNTDTNLLIFSVATGVGIAVSCGILRFLFHLSLKPFLLVIVGGTLMATVTAWLDPKLAPALGLAWDCGAVTTGPVTVPLVLALGVGISRITSKDKADLGGFGIVTLASMLPIASVLTLSFFLAPSTPAPMSQTDFFAQENRAEVMPIFSSKEHFDSYQSQTNSPAGDSPTSDSSDGPNMFLSSLIAAVQAIVPLCFGMLLVLWFLREKLQKADEIFFGIFIAIIGFAVFNIGISLGLAKLGNQTGKILPSSYSQIPLEEQIKIKEFNESIVQHAVDDDGNKKPFFFHWNESEVETIIFDKKGHDPELKTYTYQKTKGPLFGNEINKLGAIIVLLFAFLMGYGATLAEPALNALGNTVEELTAGNFKNKTLIQSVAIGVGLGLAVGVAKIIWDLPIAPLLMAPYLVLLLLPIFQRKNWSISPGIAQVSQPDPLRFP